MNQPFKIRDLDTTTQTILRRIKPTTKSNKLTIGELEIYPGRL